MTNHEDADQWGADPTEKHHPYTMIGKWATFTPMSAPAHLMYDIARGLLHDGERPSHRTRRLSMNDWRTLMGVALGEKPTDRSIRRWRKELEDAGLVRLSEETFISCGKGSLRTEARAWYVRRYPAEGAAVWDSAAQILEASAVTQGDELPVSGGHLSPHDTTCGDEEDVRDIPIENPFERTSESTRRTSESGRRTSESGHGGPDLQSPAPKKSFKNSSKNLSLPYPSHEGAGGNGRERETPAADKPVRQDIPRAVQMAMKSLKGDLAASEEDVVASALAEAAEGGLPPLKAVQYLNSRIGEGVWDEGAVHISNLRKKGLPRPKPSDLEEWMNQVCADCDLDGRLEDGRACHHGHTKTNGIKMKKCRGRECGRRIPVSAADRCGRCQRTGS